MIILFVSVGVSIGTGKKTLQSLMHLIYLLSFSL